MSSYSLAPHTILVHGLGRTQLDMLLLARRIRRLVPGTKVHLFDYRSRHLPLTQLAEQLDIFVGEVSGGAPVSFIGHSLGGIVVRALDLQPVTTAPLHRLVTLGSPHGGATIARMLRRYRSCRSIFGPVLEELAALNLDPSPRQLEIGCVVGATGTRWGFFPLFGEDNDGIVLAREAQLPGSKACTTKPVLHALLPFSSRVANLCATFLASGTFDAPKSL
jgi:pimeloyl-ACP methyl ester carboxylesterase